MSFWSAINHIAMEHPEGDPKPIARQFRAQVSEEELVDMIADAILTMRRNHVRTAEWEAFSVLPFEEECVDGFEEHISPLASRPMRISREQFVSLLDKTFAVGDRHGGVVRWGEATIPQHQARIVMLDKLVKGTLVTIDRHKQAIAIIEEERVSCLNEALQAAAN